jgi:hypothetical protein
MYKGGVIQSLVYRPNTFYQSKGDCEAEQERTKKVLVSNAYCLKLVGPIIDKNLRSSDVQ